LAAPNDISLIAPERPVRLVLLTRLITLVSAPYTLFLVATTLPADEQGFYFIFYNVQALSAVFESGIATMIVQYAAHAGAFLHWDGRKVLSPQSEPRHQFNHLLRAAQLWYLRVAAGIALVILPTGLYFLGAEALRTGIAFRTDWIVIVATLAAYVAIVPLLACLEGIGQLERVQQMRIVQGVVSTACLWFGIPRVGGLDAVAIAGVAQLSIAVGWLAFAARGLVVEAVRSLHRSGRSSDETVVVKAQVKTAAAWAVAFAAPQLLVVLVFGVQGSAAAGRVGLTLAVVTAPLTLATAWLHGRYPRYARFVASGEHEEFDRFAARATRQAVLVFAAGMCCLLAVVVLLERLLPVFATRLLPWRGVFALAGFNVAMLCYQATSGYLRAHRDEPLLAALTAGTAVSLLVATVAVRTSETAAALAYGYTALGVLLPSLLILFLRHRNQTLVARRTD
jgi:hypothetical protein